MTRSWNKCLRRPLSLKKWENMWLRLSKIIVRKMPLSRKGINSSRKLNSLSLEGKSNWSQNWRRLSRKQQEFRSQKLRIWRGNWAIWWCRGTRDRPSFLKWLMKTTFFNRNGKRLTGAEKKQRWGQVNFNNTWVICMKRWRWCRRSFNSWSGRLGARRRPYQI